MFLVLIHTNMLYMYTYMQEHNYEPPKAARSVQLRRTAFAFTRIQRFLYKDSPGLWGITMGNTRCGSVVVMAIPNAHTQDDATGCQLCHINYKACIMDSEMPYFLVWSL